MASSTNNGTEDIQVALPIAEHLARTAASISGQLYANSLTPIISLTAFCAANTILSGCAIVILRKQCQKRHRPSQLLVLAVAVLYVSSCLSWAARVYGVFALTHTITAHIQTFTSILTCVSDGSGPAGGTPILSGRNCSSITLPNGASTSLPSAALKFSVDAPFVALSLNVVVGDAIVWWRAWALWPDSRLVFVGSLVLLFANATVSAIGTYVSCAENTITPSTHLMFLHRIPITFVDGQLVGPLYECSVFGLASAVMGLLTNVSATTLIGCQAWTHRRFIRSQLGRSSRRTQVERVLALLVESGVLYTLLLILFLVLGFEIKPREATPHLTVADSDALNGVAVFIDTCLVPIISLYPTCIIVLVALQKSQCETQFAHRDVSELRFEGAPMSRASTSIAHTGAAAEARVDHRPEHEEPARLRGASWRIDSECGTRAVDLDAERGLSRRDAGAVWLGEV